jgi:hypothetical protein
MGFNPQTSIFAGMATQDLRCALVSAQRAYIDLSLGKKVVTASYTQGDGAKSLSFTPATIPDLVMLIKQLQGQLGIVHNPRRPMRPVYR